MCLNPYILPTGETIGCRVCWQCKALKINDWVGRSIAESKDSEAFAVTLTYGRDKNNNRDHMRSTVLTYSDVQKYFKKLRLAGYKFKYICAGEYGSLKGRAHWHLLMFFRGRYPEDFESLRKNIMHKQWKHGFAFVDRVDEKTARYVCKYIIKDTTDNTKQYHFMMSKKPPIGMEYFKRLAERYVEAGLSPQTYGYGFGRDEVSGKHTKYQLRGTMQRKFIDVYLAEWERRHPGKFPPYSEIIEDHLNTSDEVKEWRKERDYEAKKAEKGEKPIPKEIPTQEATQTAEAAGEGTDKGNETARKATADVNEL